MHNHEVLFNLQLSTVSVNAHEKLFIDSKKTAYNVKVLKFSFNGFNLMYTQIPIPIPSNTIATNYALIKIYIKWKLLHRTLLYFLLDYQ